MSSLRQRILDVAAELTFPLSRAELDDAVAARDADPDLLVAVSAIADDRFVDPDELAFRLDEALGVPDADTDRSVLEADTEWPAGS